MRVSIAMAEPKFWEHTYPLEHLTDDGLTLGTFVTFCRQCAIMGEIVLNSIYNRTGTVINFYTVIIMKSKAI